jgi:archaellum component FlaC
MSTNLTASQIKTKALCATNLLTLIDLSNVDTQVEYVKFSILLSDTPTTPIEIIYKVSGTPELCTDVKVKVLQSVCKEFDSAYDFYISTSSVLHFSKVDNSWDSDTQLMILTPQVSNIAQEITEVIERVSATLEDTEPLVEEVREELPLVVDISSSTTQTDESPLVEEVNEQVDNSELVKDISINSDIRVLVALRDTEDKLIKKEIGLKADDLMSLLNAWLLATGKKKQFIEAIKEKKHNSLVLYLYPALDWYVQNVQRETEITFEKIFLDHVTPICKKLSAERKEKITPISATLLKYLQETASPKDFSFYSQVQMSIINGNRYKDSTRLVKETFHQLRKREDRSERVAEIRNQTNAVIQRSGKEAIPVLGNLFHISPIQTKDDKGNIFLTQTFLKLVDTTWVQTYQNIALFTEGVLLYYGDFDEKNKEEKALRDKHGIKPVLTADGINIFPDLSIRKIALESLVPSTGNLWTTETGYRIFDKTGQPVSKQETEEVFYAVKQAELNNLTVDLSKYECDERGNLRRQEMQSKTAISFEGFSHPNLAIKSSKHNVKTERKTPKPIKLDGSKSALGSFELRAVIGKTPMLLTLEPNGTQWDLIALPLRVPPYHLSIYLSDKLNKTDLVAHIRKEIGFIQQQQKKLTQIVSTIKLENDQLPLLDSLLSLVLSSSLPSKQEVFDSTKIIESYLKKEGIREKSSYSDNYYRLHTLGYVSLVQELERNIPSYRLTVLGDEKDTRRSEVPSAINWLKRVPNNLQRVFGEKVPSYSEIKKYLMDNFNFGGEIKSGDGTKQKNRGAYLVIQDKDECIISIYYDGKLQTRQQLAIFKPVKDDKISGKVTVKFNSTIQFVFPGEFANLLKCSIADIHLIQNSQVQIEKIVQKFINSNAQRFVGGDKIATKTPTRNILGFGEKSRGYGSIAKTFMQFCTPFCKESEVDKGKFVNLHTLEVYDRHDAIKLLETMTNNWKKWNREKEDKIELGGELVKKHDPGRLMIGIHGLVTHKPEISTIVWDSVITQFYLLTELPIGFRCPNGVLLTPWDILPNRIDLWTYRIKIQLIDILYKGQQSKLETAGYYLKSKDENLELEGRELLKEARKGSVKSWLAMSIKQLNDKLDLIYAHWEKDVSQNVLDYLAELHDALNAAEQVIF